MTITRDWIEPGTTFISDSWAPYRYLESQGFTHRTVKHSIHFVDPDTGAHTNTIESTWRAVKVFFGQYKRGEDYEYHLAQYMFMARCKAFHLFCNSFTSSLILIRTCAMCCPHLTATRDHTTWHLLLQVSVVCYCVTSMTSPPLPSRI